MRASLLHVWPDLSHLFNLHPWDIGRISPGELKSYLDARDAYVREANRR